MSDMKEDKVLKKYTSKKIIYSKINYRYKRVLQITQSVQSFFNALLEGG